ncbi:hypothetical protein ERO13_A13G025100v2 [Gossypium hirsutum]|uniref:Uncharacterized protein isoform X2 n=5 Tax=Gossypium TaxID=3633 RepID=A0A1U8K533_GOSHI|nr:uncharacterized protein LOC107913479 isoform X2 [Gossypium hirsutum]KAB2047158.1 hypothetical protein ES319_A13G026400v1 [Gossypium barbadense]KAG4164575.1 hypothetical protein ERO13_A13G025100v2 [Gossypium hirsutum]TYG85081.1 hypothetical protein ES288_A13G024500v1 [Gossypium darwinii]TYI99556.1 hypothetical protein E1A91_A13G025700v1 [Gossypium mustelinum]
MNIYSNASIFLVLEKLPISMKLIVIKWKPTFIVLLLLLLMLSMPYFFAGSFDVADREVYEIDYRGPETHSSIPPPDSSHRRRHSIHRETDTLSPHKKRNVRKIHG